MKSIFHRKASNGFTIVELLVVIVVISILSVIAIVAYSGIQDRARAAERLTDIHSISTSFDVYRVVNQRYPISFNDAVLNAGLNPSITSKFIDMSGTAQNPCPTTPKTKICLYAYAGTGYSEYSLIYWDYTDKHWTNMNAGMGVNDLDVWKTSVNYGTGDYPIKP